MNLEPHFLPAGSHFPAERIAADEIYLGVGGIVHPQVFDGDSGARVTAEALWLERDAIRKRWADNDKLRVVVPQHPNWNICWAFGLLAWILEGRKLDPSKIEALNDFGAVVRKGLNPCEGPFERSVLAAFESLMDDIEMDTQLAAGERDEKKLSVGSNFLQFCYTHMTNHRSLAGGDFLNSGGQYREAMAQAKEDHRRYLHDLSNAFRFVARLRHRSGRMDRVDGLWLSSPTSRLFKFWARGENERASAGFPLLWVQWAEDRWIVSVDPALGYTLQGLGEQLTRQEAVRNPAVLAGDPRPGYQVTDPWFDGRGTPMAHTLIDSPTGGTKLSPTFVRKILKRYFKVTGWRRALAPPRPPLIDTLQRYVGLTVGLASLTALIFPILKSPQEPACDQWGPIDLHEGRKIALVIGVDDYQHSPQWKDLDTPVNDALAVWRRLIDHYGFDAKRSQLLLSPRQDASATDIPELPGNQPEKATKQNIWSALEKIADAEDVTDRDSLIVYFAGHGEMDARFNFLIPEDGKAKDRSTWLTDADMEKFFNGDRKRFRHILLILDACYASAMDLGKPMPAGTSESWWSGARRTFLEIFDRGLEVDRTTAEPDPRVKELYSLPSRQILTTGYKQRVPDALRDNAVQHSPFAHCLLTELDKRPPGVPLATQTIAVETTNCINQIPEELLPSSYKRIPRVSLFGRHCYGEFYFTKDPH